MKIIGIDIGGTHADGVFLDDGELVAKKKIAVTTPLEQTIIALLEVLVKAGGDGVDRVHLSSTLCTNAVAGNTLAPVAMLVQAGPGMNPDFLACGEHTAFIDGAIDHRGECVKAFNKTQVDAALAGFLQRGISSCGVVTKFSQRNPEVENSLAKRAAAQGFSDMSMGHTLSGLPNFPRRVYTTWLNAGLKQQFALFAKEVQKGFARLGIDAPLLVLKADGGTMPLARAVELPCESVLSGPSASVMGALALCSKKENGGGDMQKDCIVVDIGGTTTDIALFAGGQPLMEPYGISVMGRPTLIRALNTKSIALGGDSRVIYSDAGVQIGPERAGIPAAFSKDEGENKISYATPSDALVVLGRLEGNSLRAAAAMALLDKKMPPQQMAQAVITAFGVAVKKAVDSMIEQVFSRPVYTVSALLHRQRLQPVEIIAVGGPAQAFRQELAAVFSLPCSVPQNYEVANAIGAARSRSTVIASLYANSGDGFLSIPEIGLREAIDRSFSMADAEEKLRQALSSLALASGYSKENLPEIDFIEKEELNTVQGFSASGKIITLKGQIRPGLA